MCKLTKYITEYCIVIVILLTNKQQMIQKIQTIYHCYINHVKVQSTQMQTCLYVLIYFGEKRH